LEVARKISDSLSNNDKKVSLMMFGAKTEFEEAQRELNISNQNALNTQKKYIYLSLFALMGLIVIIILLRRTTIIEKKLNRELQQREQELRAINDTKNKLFSIIGHDLKGPMNNLNQLLKLYVEKQIGEDEFAQFAPKLQKDVDNVHFTLNNLLSWGKTQMQGATINPQEVVVHKLVQENCMLLNDMALNKKLEIRNYLPKEAVVWADPHHLDIVLRNLISNAIKFTAQQGRITLSAKEEGEYLVVEISDTGIGMDPETQDKILNGKGTYSTYGTNNEKGTGLGLSLCREILKKNQGSIGVRSVPKKGSTFYFSLPRKKPMDDK
jgi:signal transduction histidine kinase